MDKDKRIKFSNILLFIRKNISVIILFVGMIGFLVIANEVFNKELLKIDVMGYDLVSKYLIRDFMTPIFKIITEFGDSFVLISITILSVILLKNKKIGLSITSNLVIVTLFNLLLKNILQRPRPIEYRMINVTGYSFPSGHSMVSMAFYGFLMYLIYKYVDNKKLRWVLIGILMILIILIGLSRVYLGAHYTSDVLAGFLFSCSYLMLYIKVIKKYVLK